MCCFGSIVRFGGTIADGQSRCGISRVLRTHSSATQSLRRMLVSQFPAPNRTFRPHSSRHVDDRRRNTVHSQCNRGLSSRVEDLLSCRIARINRPRRGLTLHRTRTKLRLPHVGWGCNEDESRAEHGLKGREAILMRRILLSAVIGLGVAVPASMAAIGTSAPSAFATGSSVTCKVVSGTSTTSITFSKCSPKNTSYKSASNTIANLTNGGPLIWSPSNKDTYSNTTYSSPVRAAAPHPGPSRRTRPAR